MVGIVQGVGFRPFIHRLVTEYGLNGWIRNESYGVELELEGESDAIEAFVAHLKARPPRLAVIEALRVESCGALKNYQALPFGAARSGGRTTPSSVPMWGSVRTVSGSSETLGTGATVTPFSTAPTAAPVLPSSGMSPTTAL